MYRVRSTVALLCAVLVASKVVAQTPLYEPPPTTPKEQCDAATLADVRGDTDDIEKFCGDLNQIRNTTTDNSISIRWWEKSARLHHNADSALSLARQYDHNPLFDIFSQPQPPGVDLVKAYMWYDIAAAFATEHGESNSLEISWRDDVGKKLSQTDVLRAQQMARAWLASASLPVR